MTKNLIKLSFVSTILTIIYFSVGYSFEDAITGFTIKGVKFEPSNVIIDPNIIDYLEVNDWTPVIIRLHGDSGISYTLDIKENKVIYNRRAEFFEEAERTVLSTLSDEDLKFKSKFSSSNGFSGYVSLAGLEKLMKNPQVREIVSDYIEVKAFLSESIPLINADKVWNVEIDGNNITGIGQTICVIDTGVNSSHPGLAGKILAEACFCDSGEENGTGCCPDGNYEQFGDGSALDDEGHGTHVAGIVAANGSLKGVAFNANIVAVKVLDYNGTAHKNSDITDAIEWCTSNAETYNISVISMNFGTASLFDSNCDATYGEWYNATIGAITQGIFVDAATGNNGNVTHIAAPACITNVTSVGAVYDANIGDDVSWYYYGNYICTDSTTYADKVTCFSNRNNMTDVFAPGSEINSTIINGSYGPMSGTSMAAPHVAGLAALMKQANNSLTPADIESIIIRTG